MVDKPSPSEGVPGEPQALIEVHVDQFPDPKTVSIRANLVHVPAAVQNELQTILDCARLSLEAIDRASAFSGRFTEAHMHIEPAENRRLPLLELKAEARRWILRSAFQHAMELVNQPLEQARRVLAVWAIKHRYDLGQGIRLDFEDGAAAFHKLPLERKLAHLRDSFGFEIDSEAVAVILSLHKARNCIVHRLGHVTTVDCDSSGTMRALWEEYAVFATREQNNFSNARRVSLDGGVVEAGESIQLRRLTKVREFHPGEVIELTGQDIAEICHTVHLFASQVRYDLRKKGETLGMSFNGTMDEPRLGSPGQLRFIQ